MKVLALHNVKGGVGKTAAAVNLAAIAAGTGYRVLLWDLDPQGAASFYFRVKAKIKGGMEKLVSEKRQLESAIKESDFPGLDVIPADLSNRNMDLLLDEARKPEKRLRRLLRSLDDEYDLVILDCPPGLSLAAEAVFTAADALLVPVIPTPLSVRAFEQVREFCAEKGYGKLPIWGFISMIDRRKRLHTDTETALAADQDILSPAIPYASEVERMGVERLPLIAYAPPGSPARKAYEALWSAVDRRLFA
jgi:chromosome partitioning protein